MAAQAAGGGSSAGAGGYAAAILGVVDLMTGASADAAYEAAFGPFYTAFANMHNAANAKVAAEANIAAIKQDKINTDVAVALMQDQAEAQALVAAAVHGVEGQSVKDVVYQTEVNSAVAVSNNRKVMDQQIEDQLAQIYSSQSTMIAAGQHGVSSPTTASSIAAGLTPLLGMRGELMEGIDGLFGSTSGDIVDPMAMNYQLPTSGGLQLS